MDGRGLEDSKETQFLDVVDELRDHDVDRDLSLLQAIVWKELRLGSHHEAFVSERRRYMNAICYRVS
jgi:hypothetical protein